MKLCLYSCLLNAVRVCIIKQCHLHIISGDLYVVDLRPWKKTTKTKKKKFFSNISNEICIYPAGVLPTRYPARKGADPSVANTRWCQSRWGFSYLSAYLIHSSFLWHVRFFLALFCSHFLNLRIKKKKERDPELVKELLSICVCLHLGGTMS